MSPMMFPRMFSSHGEGWDWLMRIHPSVTRMFFSYVLPMSIIPPAMLFYAGHTYRGAPLPEVGTPQLMAIVTLFFITELVAVPLMAKVIQRLGQVADCQPAYHDAYALAAVAPTPLWLAPLCLFIPSLLFNVMVGVLAWFGAGLLIYQGVYRVYGVEDEGHSLLLAGSVLAAGLVAWAAMMVLTLVSWGWAVVG